MEAPAGTPYSIHVDGDRIPDPASRLQHDDVHGPSVLVDHDTYAWGVPWTGRPWHEAVIYEMHVGTFTAEGTFAAAAAKLDRLAELGITALEIMPVGQWSGRRGWGYDGVLPFAPHPAYGTPDDFKAFVERAHELGLMVLLDVVMNHFGPDGAYIHRLAPEFFDDDRHTPWGAAINFNREAVRRFWIDCALMWIEDYRLDGLRLDAVHQITGPGSDRFFDELSHAVRGLDAGRPLHLVVEDERNEPGLRESGKYDASWNDDFHHAVHTALTGESGGYYASFAVDPIGDLCLALERGHIEEGQDRPRRKSARGAPSSHLAPTAFVNATQTHDQVGNRALGERLVSLADPAAVEIAFALLLVCPYIPMIFMGEEQGARTPFLFFADYGGELGEMVRKGRAEEFAEIAALAGKVPDPIALETFEASKLTWGDTPDARHWRETTRACLAFRAEHTTPLVASGREDVKVSRTGDRALYARWTFAAGTLDLYLNFGGVGRFETRPDAPQLAFNVLETDPYALSIEARAK
ncbi:malto-oligosyltrehalose trehalohydrolase [Devosia nitrariae]|uniref:Malto-oligosyltrehalose trehalohydrolase n=1 Tax=Devosia nitrariae TaxID=2071872 RepID=A0ABQ5W2T1_9HYPH|nr:malto-oligosyltrehalose trehalohydrolase [Devosia nitrariae]